MGTGKTDASEASWSVGGLVCLLVLLAAVAPLFTGRYPDALHALIVGIDRWAIQVVA